MRGHLRCAGGCRAAGLTPAPRLPARANDAWERVSAGETFRPLLLERDLEICTQQHTPKPRREESSSSSSSSSSSFFFFFFFFFFFPFFLPFLYCPFPST